MERELRGVMERKVLDIRELDNEKVMHVSDTSSLIHPFQCPAKLKERRLSIDFDTHLRAINANVDTGAVWHILILLRDLDRLAIGVEMRNLDKIENQLAYPHNSSEYNHTLLS